ncbi:hypothetical protein [Streptomyces sp. NPDC001851]|uniref:hypothetical protein n=1 Tax=Streptomyces sp. NPDC001851 TaxID=3154529 RepID=UPI003334202F
MARGQINRVIGALFGLIFIEANAGALPSSAGIPLRVLAIGAFLVLLVALRRGHLSTQTTHAPQQGFGRRYWAVVVIEAVAGLTGIVLINGLLQAPLATLPWIAFVVGLHFFGLAAVWRMSALVWLGAAMSACGVAGLALAAWGSSAVIIAAVAGVAPGALLLGSAAA